MTHSRCCQMRMRCLTMTDQLRDEVKRIVEDWYTDGLMCMDDPDFHVPLATRLLDIVAAERETAYRAGRADGYSECMREWQTSRGGSYA
jgi:hypothetical protein